MRARVEVLPIECSQAVEAVEENLDRRIREKGACSYISVHEAYGVLAEEFNKELLDAVHANNEAQCYKELVDVAVGCLFAMASLAANARVVQDQIERASKSETRGASV